MSRWAAPVALLIAVVAVALAIWALMGASPRAPETALAGDPKMPVCTAFDTVSKAVTLQTNADLGPDPVALEAVAGNARLALIGRGQYLLSRLDSAIRRSWPMLFAHSPAICKTSGLTCWPECRPPILVRPLEWLKLMQAGSSSSTCASERGGGVLRI